MLQYNDLENHIYSAKLTMAGATLIYRNNNYGDSGLSKAVENDGDGEGSVWAVRYDMGNVSIGYATESLVILLTVSQRCRKRCFRCWL